MPRFNFCDSLLRRPVGLPFQPGPEAPRPTSAFRARAWDEVVSISSAGDYRHRQNAARMYPRQ